MPHPDVVGRGPVGNGGVAARYFEVRSKTRRRNLAKSGADLLLLFRGRSADVDDIDPDLRLGLVFRLVLGEGGKGEQQRSKEVTELRSAWTGLEARPRMATGASNIV